MAGTQHEHFTNGAHDRTGRSEYAGPPVPSRESVGVWRFGNRYAVSCGRAIAARNGGTHTDVAAMTRNPFVEFVERYGPAAGELGPELFVEEVLGVTPDRWQREEVLRPFGRGVRKISIRSCHGPGKTAVLAWLVVYMLCTRYPQKTAATAPSKGQLEDALVAEVNSWMAKLPPALLSLFEMKKNRIELRAAPDDSFFTARTAREENPEALQGIHSENVLLIVDEASGVHEKIFEAAVGSMSGHNATTIMASNPVRTSGFFFDSHNRNRAQWHTVHVSAFDTPRVSCEFVQEVADTYGEDSNAYRVRVLGEFPTGDLDTIVPYELIDSAMNRDVDMPDAYAEVWGLDVARFGDDSTVLVRRTKRGLRPKIMTWKGKDLMETAGRVKAEWDALPPSRRPEIILVDDIGVGGGVVDRLRELELPARGINVSETKNVDDRYRNLRTELYFKAKEWLEGRGVSMPKCDGSCPVRSKCVHEALAAELSSVRYKYNSSGKIIAEPKDEIKKRIGHSPDYADAFVLTFAQEPASLLHGSGRMNAVSMSKPLVRDIGIV